VSLDAGARQHDLAEQAARTSIKARISDLNRAVGNWLGALIDEGQGEETPVDHLVIADVLPWRIELLQFLMGVAFGRWSVAARKEPQLTIQDLLREPKPCRTSVQVITRLLVDDVGHADDAVFRLASTLADWGIRDDLDNMYSGGIRQVLRTQLFGKHIAHYSAVGRKAPIYWQLATPSASYSIWLYLLTGKQARYN
jgi:hypothetical protein